MEINKNNLEKAFDEQQNKTAQPQISKEEEIGFHKGCLNTLANERAELFKMLQNVEAIMQAHIQRLEELGVKVQSQENQQQE